MAQPKLHFSLLRLEPSTTICALTPVCISGRLARVLNSHLRLACSKTYAFSVNESTVPSNGSKVWHVKDKPRHIIRGSHQLILKRQRKADVVQDAGLVLEMRGIEDFMSKFPRARFLLRLEV